jgi:hypothetical protein
MPLQCTRSRLMSPLETDTFVMAVSILRSESRVPSAQSLHNSHAVQSLMSCTLGALLLAAASLKSTTWRSVAVTVALTALLALALIAPLPSDRFVMGDGSSIVQDRGNFDDLVAHGARVVRFSAHLAYRLLGRFDAALGSTADSPVEAYRMLSWLAGLVFAVTLWCLAAAERWNLRSVRYTALALMAPATLMYFGYLEVGYLSLSAAAFPFISRDLTRGRDLTVGVLVGAILFGLGAAMHGIGYLSIAALFFAVIADDRPIQTRVVLATALSGIAIAAALIWVWYYLSVLGLDVIPGHAAGGFILRPLSQEREAEGRILYPLLSLITARDIFLSGVIAGLPLVLVALFVRQRSPREARLALAFSIACAIAFLLFWPVQGIAIEMDMIVALFPAVFALLWVAATSLRASIASAALLVLGHAVFWWVVLDDRFINRMLR